MKSIDALARLADLGVSAFTTNDAGAALGIDRAHASKTLTRLAAARQLLRLHRGLWAFPGKVDRFRLPEALAAPAPCYVSMQSALYLHGMISQIPQVLYAVSPGRTRRCETPLGAVSIHHVQPSFFKGFVADSRSGAPVATPEKALADLLYLAPGRSRLFATLPELELPRNFRKARLLGYLRLITSPRRRAMATRLWERLNTQAA